MAPKIKRRYKVLGIWHTVIREHPVLFNDKNGDEHGEEVLAKINTWDKTIHIDSEIDDDIAFRALIHELTHASDPGGVLSEEITAVVSHIFTQILFDNDMVK